LQILQRLNEVDEIKQELTQIWDHTLNLELKFRSSK